MINSTVVPVLRDVQDELKKIQELKSDIKVLDTKLENIRCDTTEMNEIINRFRVTLYGNGDVTRPGLITTVSQIQAWVDARSSYEKLIVSALIGEFIGLIFLFAKALLGF